MTLSELLHIEMTTLESELTSAIKSSEKEKKKDDQDRKDGDKSKVDKDKQASDKEKEDTEPNKPKQNIPADQLAGAGDEEPQDGGEDGGEDGAEAPQEAPEDKEEDKGDEEDKKEKKVVKEASKLTLAEFAFLRKAKARLDDLMDVEHDYKIAGTHKKTDATLYLDKESNDYFAYDEKLGLMVKVPSKTVNKEYKLSFMK